MRRKLLTISAGLGLLVGWLWPMPVADSPGVAQVSAATWVPSRVVLEGQRQQPSRASRDVDRQPVCRDRLAQVLWRAGFRGESWRTAWAIAMRESRGQSLDESSPWYTGALGIFQIQTSAHSGKPWWSRAAMLDPDRQARIVFRHMTGGGRDWRHWGIGPGGTTDATMYGGWSAAQVDLWITRPFRLWWGQFPCR